MAMFENFPYTNLHELNLDWLIDQLNKISESSVLSVNGQTGVVTLYEDAQMVLPNVPQDNWTLIRMCDGTYRGILFGNDDKAYIIHDNLMAQIYSQNNQPPYPVTRVNGLYGDVELYTEQYVRLPDLDDNQMTNWTFFRMLNNKSHGIQFEDDGTAYIINGTSRYILYTSNNVPPYPVDSVNGQTGAVVLFTDTNGNVSYPAFTDPDYEGWSINRSVNGTNIGLEFKDDGRLVLKVGAAEYTVYTSNEPMETYVEDATDSIQQVTEDSSDNFWALMRDTTEGSIGILFENYDPDNPSAYIAYVDSNDQAQQLKILTPADIPATGVISVNAQTGIVVLTGSDIEMSSSDSRTIDDAMEDTQALTAYVETTNTASQAYSVGEYVVWQNTLHVVSNAIAASDTLSASNLTQIDNMGTVVTDLATDLASIELRTINIDYPSSFTANSAYHTNLKTLVDADLPAGKRCIGIVGYDSGHSNVAIVQLRYFAGAYSFQAKNFGATDIANANAKVIYLCINT